MSDERATPDPDEPKLGLPEELSGRRKVDAKPPGLPMTPSARKRLELVIDHDRNSSHPPPAIIGGPQEELRLAPPPALPREMLEASPKKDEREKTDKKEKEKENKEKAEKPEKQEKTASPAPHAQFGPAEAKQLRRLARWVLLCGLLALGTGGIASAGALMGRPGVVGHAIVGILTGALGVWLASAAYAFWRMARRPAREVHRLIDGLGLLRTALLLKAVLLFTTLTLGCFTFSLAAALLFLPW